VIIVKTALPLRILRIVRQLISSASNTEKEFTLKISVSLAAIILLAGCSSVSVVEQKKANFNINDTVTVISKGNDPLNLQGELEHILLSRGYDVVSQDVAVQKAKLVINMDYNNNKAKGGAEVYNTTELKSVYSLSFSYSSRFDGIFREKKIVKFYGSPLTYEQVKL